MLKSKIKFTREVRKKVSAFSLSTLRSRATAEDGQPSAFACSAFTLVELLVVISIMAILAALAVPALKNIGHSDSTISASRQLLDDVARARQLAISQRTTVYMVFVPTNFWADAVGNLNIAWFNNLTVAQQTAATNLCDKQLTGYTFIAKGAMGDQPGNHQWHYLASWQTLPDNTFIALAKFANSPAQSYPIKDLISGAEYYDYGFSVTNTIPFPTETATNGVWLPYIAFDYRGQLVSGRNEYIPLTRGSVLPAIDPNDPAKKAYGLLPPPNGSPSVSELPPGNSINAYNIIDIEPLTGRAVLEYQKVK